MATSYLESVGPSPGEKWKTWSPTSDESGKSVVHR